MRGSAIFSTEKKMKSNLHKDYATSKEAEKDGVWLEPSDGIRFLVKRFGGKNGQSVKEAHAKYMRPHARKIENGSMSDAKENAVLTKFFVSSCLIGWEGVEIEGEIVPYDFDTATKLFTELPDLLKALIEEANNIENYKDSQREELGNS